MTQLQSYHNHKEAMAHAGFVVQLVLLTAIFGANTWPPCWMPDAIPKEITATIGIVVIWLLIHIYIRWQLRQRRFAALFIKCAIQTLKDWENSGTGDMAYPKEISATPEVKKIYRCADYLLPCKKARVPMDEGLEGYPLDFTAKMKTEYTGALFGERLVWVGSITTLVIMLFRTLS